MRSLQRLGWFSALFGVLVLSGPWWADASEFGMQAGLFIISELVQLEVLPAIAQGMRS